MRIAIGRRHLVVSLQDRAECADRAGYPMAAEASDAELARLNNLQLVANDRARWETSAILYGAIR